MAGLCHNLSNPITAILLWPTARTSIQGAGGLMQDQQRCVANQPSNLPKPGLVPPLTSIQCACCFIQDQQRRVAHQRPRNGDALPLPAAEQLVGDRRGKALREMDRHETQQVDQLEMEVKLLPGATV